MTKDIVSFFDFQKLDFRVGKVVKAEEVEGSMNLLRLFVDLGKDYGEKKIFAGIAKWYKPEQLQGKKYIFIANLAPKQMMKEISEGMILCAVINEEAVLIPVEDSIPEGTILR